MPPKIAKKTVQHIPIPKPQSTQQIQRIIDQKINQQGNVSYLVQWKNAKTIQQCSWQPQFNLTTFKDKIQEYQQNKINADFSKLMHTQKIEPKGKKTTTNTKNQEISTSTSKMIVEQSKRVRQSSTEKQKSLDGFIKGVQKKIKKNEEEDQIISDKPTTKKSLNSTADTFKQAVVKTAVSQIKKSSLQKILEQPKKSDNLLDKVVSITKITRFQVKNGQIEYDCMGQDNQKQQMYLPPVCSSIVNKLNPQKLVDFLQSCLLKGYLQHSSKS